MADRAAGQTGTGSRTHTETRSPMLMLVMATVGFAVNFWAWALISPLGPMFRDTGTLGELTESDVALLVAVPVLVGSLGRIIVGALTAHPTGDESRELLLYAIGYAASTGGRGATRVGLATSGSLAGLSWERAVAKVARLGEVGRLAEAPVEERRAAIDPRAVDPRSAALGRYEPASRRPRRRTPPGH